MSLPADRLSFDANDQPLDKDATVSMSPNDAASKLANVLDAYLAELQAGRHPDRLKLIAEHPDLASQLECCLSGIEFIQRASGPLPQAGSPTQLGDFPNCARSRSGRYGGRL